MHDEQEAEREDFAVELSDLPTTDLDQHSAQLLYIGQNIRTLSKKIIQRPYVLPSISLAFMLAMTLLLSGSQGYRPLPTPQSGFSLAVETDTNIIQIPTQGGNGPKTIISWTQGDGTWMVQSGILPNECAQGSSIGNIHLIGSYPVWITGMKGPNASVTLLTQQKINEQPWVGWDVPLSVEIIHGVHGPITFSFVGLSAGLPPLLSEPINGIYSSAITFNPDYPIRLMAPQTDKAISNWNFKLHLGNRGCYLVNADWPSGHWSIFFIAK